MGEQQAPQIKIRASAESSSTRITICDNGIGIDPQYHKKIFQLFERLDASTPGTGIGLTLVRRIVEAHGGKVWVESEGEGKGSSFVINLPLGPLA